MTARWGIDPGDCREVLREADDNCVDSCVTDPPYELGFMGKKWDGSGVAFQVETWAEILRVLKPGSHLLAFGAPRTYHRLACAIEDAGFEIRDSIHWLYGSGMPKGKTVLKPGHEPVVLARKALDGTIAANIAKWGVGALRIDDCRIRYASDADKESAKPGTTPATVNGNGATHGHMVRAEYVQPEGRWPVNVVLDEDAAAELDAHSGERRSAGYYPSTSINRDGNATGFTQTQGRLYADSGGASRFFYTSKASKRERNTGCAVGNDHPTVKPIALMRHLVRLVTPTGGIVLDPFCGSGTTGIAALLEELRFVGIEQSAEYVEIARQRIAHADDETTAACNHFPGQTVCQWCRKTDAART